MSYKLYFNKRKRNGRTEKALTLYHGRDYIKQVKVINKNPTLNDLYILRNKTGLFKLDWMTLWDKLTETNKECRYCGKPITTNKPFQRQKLYCSEECRREADKKRRRDKQYRKHYKKRFENDTLMHTYSKLGKKLPEGFNQIDEPKRLGETRLTKNIKTDETGEYDFTAEYHAIKNEKNRILNRV